MTLMICLSSQSDAEEFAARNTPQARHGRRRGGRGRHLRQGTGQALRSAPGWHEPPDLLRQRES